LASVLLRLAVAAGPPGIERGDGGRVVDDDQFAQKSTKEAGQAGVSAAAGGFVGAQQDHDLGRVDPASIAHIVSELGWYTEGATG